MRISRIKITKFANFSDLDVQTGFSIVIVGEDKVGKSNFVRALQLFLDPGLSERDRQLGLEHFWDGLGEDKLGETVKISVELTDYKYIIFGGDDPEMSTGSSSRRMLPRDVQVALRDGEKDLASRFP